MSDWNDLERLWQSLPPQAAPAADELRRLHRWRWASYALIGGDILMTLIGSAVGVWLLTRANAFMVLLGVATIVIVIVSAALSWWARSITQVRVDDPVAQALAVAVRRARIGVRLAVATQWAICMGLLFTALVTFGRSFGTAHTVAATNMGFMAVALTQIWMAGALAATILYHRKRTADLARLEALQASLAD
jgi:hypothetical protein